MSVVVAVKNERKVPSQVRRKCFAAEHLHWRGNQWSFSCWLVRPVLPRCLALL